MSDIARVLIVDDDQLARELLEALLIKEGYDLVFATNGVEALERAKAEPPDVVLLDVMMPLMNGFEVCRHLREDPGLAEMPVIMMTSLDDHDSRMKGIEAGADDYVSKPFDHAELRARVRTTTRLNRYRKLLEGQAKFLKLVELSPFGIAVVDDSYMVQASNPEMARILGIKNPDSVIGKDLCRFISPNQIPAYSSYVQSAISDSSRRGYTEACISNVTGDSIPVEISAEHLVWDEKPAAQVIFRDITLRNLVIEQTKELESLRQQKLRWLANQIRRNPLSFLNTFGITLTWTLVCLSMVIFFRAVFAPDNTISITVNEYKEMWIEIPVFILVFGAITFNTVNLWDRFMKGE